MTWFLIGSFLIVAGAAAVQAVTGFGFALLAVPLLAVIADAPTAVVGTSVVGLIPTAVTAVRDRGTVAWRAVAWLVAAAACGIPLGLLVLRATPPRWLAALIALVVIGCAAIVWRPPRLPTGPGTLCAVGLLTGVLTTATATNGPPLVAALTSQGYDRRALRATLAAIFFATGVLAVSGFVIAGAVTERASQLAAVGVPAAVVGWLCGDRVFSHLKAETFRSVVLAALVACSLLMVGRAVAG